MFYRDLASLCEMSRDRSRLFDHRDQRPSEPIRTIYQVDQSGPYIGGSELSAHSICEERSHTRAVSAIEWDLLVLSFILFTRKSRRQFTAQNVLWD